MTGLETAYAVLNTVLSDTRQEKLIELLSVNPAGLFGKKHLAIKEGEKAALTLFNPAEKWMVQEKMFNSKSGNSPFTGKELKGKVIGIINKDNLFLNN